MNRLRPFGISNHPGTSIPTNPAVALDLADTDSGFLPNRLTTTQRNAISDPPMGLLIWNTSTVQYEGYNGSAWVPIGSGGGLTGFTASLNTASPNDVTNASMLEATGGTGSQDVVIAPIGIGALTATLADGTGAGGNKRGFGAVDLQIFQFGKNSATQVASGRLATIGGGANNTASGLSSTVGGGQGNSTTLDNDTVGGGTNNTASGGGSTVGGGDNNNASGSVSTVGGGDNNNASANVSTVGGGEFNTASGSASTIGGGEFNTASANVSTVGGGDNNNASGSASTIGGGGNNVASGTRSWIPGGYGADTRGIVGFGAVAAGTFAVSGDAQLGILPLLVQTTDATPTVLTSNLDIPSIDNQVILPNNSTFGFHGYVLAREGATGDSAYFIIGGLIKRTNGASSTSFVGSPTGAPVFSDSGASTWTIGVTADITHGGIAVTVTGEVSKIIHWIGRIETEELVF